MKKILSSLSLPSPLEPLEIKGSISFYIKRDDLIHPEISGNKFRKLKGYLTEYESGNYDGLITFGGAFSNHIYATAASARLANIPCIGVIRGDGLDPNNPTLSFAEACGMQLEFFDRTTYRAKEKSEQFKVLRSKFPNYLIIPEGGNGPNGIEGLRDLVAEIIQHCPGVDLIVSAIGTGTTVAGLLQYSDCKVLGIPVLKNKNAVSEIEDLLLDKSRISNLICKDDYHFGGYAKVSDELLDFKLDFESKFKIPLDPIYTSKMLAAVSDLNTKEFFREYKNVVVLHTGGLQGNVGFRYRFPNRVV